MRDVGWFVGVSALGLLMAAGPVLSQPGMREAVEAPARDVGAPEDEAVAEAVEGLPVVVLLANGESLIANWLAIDMERVRLVDSATNQMVSLPVSDVVGAFLASVGARASLGVGGIASAMVRPLVPGERLMTRTGAGEFGMLRAVDGMTLPGSIKPSAEQDDEVVRWEDPILGPWAIEIDRVAWVWRERVVSEWLGFTAMDAAVPGEDVVALANGDRISGFVLEIGTVLEMERSDGTLISFPTDRVSGVWLANPLEEREGAWAFTDLGLALPMGRVMGSSSEHWTGTVQNAAGEPVRIAHGELSALVLAAERLVPLASLVVESAEVGSAVDGGELAEGLVARVRHPLEAGLPIGSAFGVDDLLLRRAMVCRWSLPEGSERFVATARLPDPRNPWSEADLVVEVDGVERSRFALTPEQPSAAVNVEAVGRELTVRVEPGRFGAVQNAVLLHRPMVIRGE